MIKHCYICHSIFNGKEVFCPSCHKKLTEESLDSYMKRCPKCFYPKISGEYECLNCKDVDVMPIYSFTDYKAAFSKYVLETFKFFFDRKIRYVFAFIFNQILQKCGIDINKILIVPVPCSKKSLHRRGWDHMNEVSKVLHKKYRYMNANLIKNKSKEKFQQKELTKEQRKEYSKNKYSYIKPLNEDKLKKYQIVLIDDVVTTGSTLKSCEELLRSRGFKKIMAVTWFNEM